MPPGGWAFEFANDNYPDIDDTAVVVLALDHVRGADPARVRAAVDRAVHWTIGMQCRDGGLGAFDADNDNRLIGRLPFCDFGEVTDPPSADVTAHVVEMLARPGLVDRGGAVDAESSDGPSRGCPANRRTTGRGSGGGAPTTCTGPVPRCPR